MAFIVRRPPYRPWPVTVSLYVSSPTGEVSTVEQTFVGHFAPFTEAEHEAICAAVDAEFARREAVNETNPADTPADAPALTERRTLERNAAYFARVMVGWDGITDEAGQPVPWSADALAQLVTGLDGRAISNALFLAVSEIRAGVAPIKNSTPSVAPGDLSSAAGGATPATATT